MHYETRHSIRSVALSIMNKNNLATKISPIEEGTKCPSLAFSDYKTKASRFQNYGTWSMIPDPKL